MCVNCCCLPSALFVSGESYAGIYVPTLAWNIMTKENSINMKGFMVGHMTYTHTHRQIHTHTCTHARTHTHTHTHASTHALAKQCTLHTWRCAHTRMQVHARTHTYVHSHFNVSQLNLHSNTMGSTVCAFVQLLTAVYSLPLSECSCWRRKQTGPGNTVGGKCIRG